jgi:hypothetical protein
MDAKHVGNDADKQSNMVGRMGNVSETPAQNRTGMTVIEYPGSVV